jgi:hypothetical protein
MGRKPWTDRLTVEQCSRLSISEIVRAGVFRVDLGTWSSCRWIDGDGKQVRIALFRLLRGDDGGLILRFQQSIPRGLSSSSMPYDQTARITIMRCNFGGWRPWFHCPKLTKGIACGRRVRDLYLPPSGVELGCRSCLNLTYWSCQGHDVRLDRILRLPIGQFKRALNGDTKSFGMLNARIGALLRCRIAKRIERRRLKLKPRKAGP